MNPGKWKKNVKFQSLGDERGSLVALEPNLGVGFDIKRVYYIFYTERGVSRGYHAHRKLRQLAVCITGSCSFLLDNGIKQEKVILNKSTEGLSIDGAVWREIHDFSEDCVLLVLADEVYDEDDYIRNYEDFLREVNCDS